MILISQWLHEKHWNFNKGESINSDENSDGKGSRQLAEKYGVGRTQVQNLMKRKCEILDS